MYTCWWELTLFSRWNVDLLGHFSRTALLCLLWNYNERVRCGWNKSLGTSCVSGRYLRLSGCNKLVKSDENRRIRVKFISAVLGGIELWVEVLSSPGPGGPMMMARIHHRWKRRMSFRNFFSETLRAVPHAIQGPAKLTHRNGNVKVLHQKHLLTRYLNSKRELSTDWNDEARIRKVREQGISADGGTRKTLMQLCHRSSNRELPSEVVNRYNRWNKLPPRRRLKCLNSWKVLHFHQGKRCANIGVHTLFA